MMLWTSNENPAYLKVVYDIETTKADIVKLKAQLARLEEDRASALSQVELIQTNLEYIRKYAKVVSMREYVKLTHMLAGELEAVIFTKNSIIATENLIKTLNQSLARLEARLPQFQSKVLEFKRRD